MKKAFFIAIITFLCAAAANSAEKESLPGVSQETRAEDSESLYKAALSIMFDKHYSKERKELAPDYRAAFPLLNSSAQMGHSKSQFLLGRLYEYGRGTKRDDAKAIYWYKKAADAGEEDAMCPLAKLYSQSDVFPKDPEVSRKCFMK